MHKLIRGSEQSSWMQSQATSALERVQLLFEGGEARCSLFSSNNGQERPW